MTPTRRHADTPTRTFFLITAFGPDRSGMVAELTREVFRLRGNIEDTSMTRLGGEFVMMLVVRLPHAAAGKRLLHDLPGFKKHGLNVSARALPANRAMTRQVQPTHLISLYGTDRSGIVYYVAQALADQRINITDLHTKSTRAAGKAVYFLLLEIQLASRAKAAALERTLARLRKRLHVDITLREIDPVAL